MCLGPVTSHSMAKVLLSSLKPSVPFSRNRLYRNRACFHWSLRNAMISKEKSVKAPGRKSKHIILKLIKYVLFSTCQVQCVEGNVKFNRSLISGVLRSQRVKKFASEVIKGRTWGEGLRLPTLPQVHSYRARRKWSPLWEEERVGRRQHWARASNSKNKGFLRAQRCYEDLTLLTHKSSHRCHKEGATVIPSSQMNKARQRELQQNTLTSCLEITSFRMTSRLLFISSFLFLLWHLIIAGLGCPLQFNSTSAYQIQVCTRQDSMGSERTKAGAPPSRYITRQWRRIWI